MRQWGTQVFVNKALLNNVMWKITVLLMCMSIFYRFEGSVVVAQTIDNGIDENSVLLLPAGHITTAETCKLHQDLF